MAVNAHFNRAQKFVYPVAFSIGGKSLASGSSENSVLILDLWTVEGALEGFETMDLSTLTDGDACQHPRKQTKPAPVPGFSCEGCYQEGASFA